MMTRPQGSRVLLSIHAIVTCAIQGGAKSGREGGFTNFYLLQNLDLLNETKMI